MDYVFWDCILTRVTIGEVQFMVGKKLLLNAHNVANIIIQVEKYVAANAATHKDFTKSKARIHSP